MNILGHACVAVRAVPGKRKLLITGALLPEASPFIPDNPLTWEEIHESGEKFLSFLDKNCPEKRDLALGVLSHSLEYGADGFNQEIEKYIKNCREEFLEKISSFCRVNLKEAEHLAHNFLSGGLDFWIFQTNRKLAREVAQVIEDIDTKEISHLLLKFFKKDRREVEKMTGKLFQEIYRPEDLNSVEGLVRIWTRQAAGLENVGQLDFSKTLDLVENSADLIKGDWSEFLDKVVSQVQQNLLPFKEIPGSG